MITDALLRPNKKRGKNAISMMWAVMACYISFSLINILLIHPYPGVMFNTYHTVISGLSNLLTTLYFVLFLLSGIFYIMWFRRAYYNLNELRHDTLYSDGWCAAFWFIPIANLYKPYLLMKELYNKTNDLLSDDITGCVNQKPLTYINIWWFLWITYWVLTNLFTRLLLITNGQFYIIQNIIAVIIFINLTIIAVKVVRDYMKMEEILHDIVEDSRQKELQKLEEN